MDFMLDPQNASQNIAYFGYPMAVTGSEEAFAKIAKDDPSIEITVDDLKHGQQFAYLTGQDKVRWDRAWTEVKAA
jgi:spermidine/putrescine-binding protein